MHIPTRVSGINIRQHDIVDFYELYDFKRHSNNIYWGKLRKSDASANEDEKREHSPALPAGFRWQTQ